jgi:hypothetical protein
MSQSTLDVHPLTAAGAIVGVFGVLDSSQVLPIVGPVLTIIGLVMDWFLRRQTRREMDRRMTELLALEVRLKDREAHP